MQIDPTLPDAYGLLGLIYMDLDDRRAAEENFQRALQLDGNNPDLNNNYGWFLCQTGREREAIGYFQRALRDPLYATPARASLSAGVCLMRIKDYPDAEPFLRRSFELDAANPTAKYELARLYLATGQTERAAFYYGLLAKNDRCVGRNAVARPAGGARPGRSAHGDASWRPSCARAFRHPRKPPR